MIIHSIVEKFQAICRTSIAFYHLRYVQNSIDVINLFCGVRASFRLTEKCFKSYKFTVPPALKRYNHRAIKIAYIMGDLSYVLNALNSRPVLAASRYMIRRICSTEVTARMIGPLGLFNHTVGRCVGVSAWILGMPSILLFIYLLIAKEETPLTEIEKQKLDVAKKRKHVNIKTRLACKTFNTIAKINQVVNML